MHPEELIYVPKSELDKLGKGSRRQKFIWFSSGMAWGLILAVILGLAK